MNEPRLLPSWAEDLRRRYLRGEASMFVLHGNVYDVVVHGQKTSSLVDFLTDVLLKDTRESIAVYNMATGPRFAKRAAAAGDLDDVLWRDAQGQGAAGPRAAARGLDARGGDPGIRRVARPGGRPDLPGGRGPVGHHHAPPLVVAAGDRKGRQHHPAHRREPQRPGAEDRLESQGGRRRRADARPRPRARPWPASPTRA